MTLTRECPICGGVVDWCQHEEHSCHYIVCGSCAASFNLERCVAEDLLYGPLEPLQESIAWVWNERLVLNPHQGRSSMTDCIFCNGTGKQNEHRHDNAHPLDRAINESHRYQAMCFESWRGLRQQQKGLNRQRKLIRRLQAENARLRNNMAWAVATARLGDTSSAGDTPRG